MTAAGGNAQFQVSTEGYGEVVYGPVKVSFGYIGEGVSGDYHEDDPNDEPLLRLDVLVSASCGYGGEETSDPAWLYPDQGSICTQVREDATEQERIDALRHAAEYLRDVVERDESVKHAMDRLSWLPQARV